MRPEYDNARDEDADARRDAENNADPSSSDDEPRRLVVDDDGVARCCPAHRFTPRALTLPHGEAPAGYAGPEVVRDVCGGAR